MKYIFKTDVAEIVVNASTNRKTCTSCNGKGQVDTDFGMDQCGSCEGSGDFIDELILIDNDVVVNKYFSKHDREKIMLIKELHKNLYNSEMYIYENLPDFQREQVPPPKEKDIIVKKLS
tara:strand:- start:177 stop:533 length:357 start_codon:yes stop_codon:yes gene_type:complete